MLPAVARFVRNGLFVLAGLVCAVAVQADITISPSSGTLTGTTGVSYSQQFSASGGSESYTWSDNSTLPGWLSLLGDTISGTPSSSGSYYFSLYVSDDGGSTWTQADYALVISDLPPSLTISGSLTGGVTGGAYSQTLIASGGSGGNMWLVSSGSLPGGLTLDGASGTLSGTPNMAGDYSFTVTVTDASSTTASASYQMTIYDPPSISGSLPDGMVNVSYSQSLSASGGSGNYSWTVSGQPGWMQIDSSGNLNGTPTATGTYYFTVTVTDLQSGGTAQATYGITINPAPISVSNVSVSPGLSDAWINFTVAMPYGGSSCQSDVYLNGSWYGSGSPDENGNVYLAISGLQPNQGYSLSIQTTANISGLGNYSVWDGAGGFQTQPDSTLQFSAASYQANENDGTVTITVNRAGSCAGTVSVDYSGDGSGTVTFDPNETSKTFTINIYDDGTYNGDSTYTLTLSNPQGGAALGSQNTAALTIMETDPPPPPPQPPLPPAPADPPATVTMWDLRVDAVSATNVTISWVATASGETSSWFWYGNGWWWDSVNWSWQLDGFWNIASGYPYSWSASPDNNTVSYSWNGSTNTVTGSYDLTSGRVIATLTGLTPGRSYSFAASSSYGNVAANEDGQPFTMLGFHITASPTVSSVTGDSATVNWQVDNNTGLSLHHVVHYSGGDGHGNTDSGQVESETDPNTGSVSVILNGLRPGCNYTYWVESGFDDSSYVVMDNAQGNNYPLATSAIITLGNPHVENVTSTSMDIVWDVAAYSGCLGYSCDSAAHSVTYSDTDPSGAQSQLVSTNEFSYSGSQVRVPLSGLVSGHTYTCSVQTVLNNASFDDLWDGSLSLGDVPAVNTLQATTIGVRIVGAPDMISVDGNNATLRWIVNNTTGQSLQNYVNYSWTDGSDSGTGQVELDTDGSSGTISVTLGSLVPGRNYSFWVQSGTSDQAYVASNGNNDGNSYGFTTEAAPSITSSGPTIQQHLDDPTQFDISWDVTPVDPANHVHVVNWANGPTYGTEDGNGHVTATLTGLALNTTYYVKIQSSGWGQQVEQDNYGSGYPLTTQPSPLVINTQSLPDGTDTWSYSQTLNASGGSGSNTWSLLNGNLPSGLDLDPSSGTIGGTLSMQGTYGFTIGVSDWMGHSTQATYQISVGLPQQPPDQTQPPSVSASSPSVGAVDDTTATISWTAAASYNSGYWSWSDSSGWNWIDTGWFAASPGNTVNYNGDGSSGTVTGDYDASQDRATVMLTGLTPGTTYSFTAVSGYGSVSATAGSGTFTTTGTPPPPPPSLSINSAISITYQTAGDYSSNTVTVAWHVSHVPSDASLFTHSVHVSDQDDAVVANGQEDGNGWVTAQLAVPVGTTHHLWVESSGNGFDVQDRNGGNNYTVSGPALISISSNVEANSVGYTDATVSWAIQYNYLCTVQNSVTYADDSGSHTVSADYDSLTGRISAQLSGLAPGRGYNFTVLSDSGWNPANYPGGASATQDGSFTTMSLPSLISMGSPYNETLAQDSMGVISEDIVWNVTVDPGVTPNGITHSVTFSDADPSGLQNQTVSVTDNSNSGQARVTVSNLQLGHTYNVAAQSVLDGDWSQQPWGGFSQCITAMGALQMSLPHVWVWNAHVDANSMAPDSVTVAWTTETASGFSGSSRTVVYWSDDPSQAISIEQPYGNATTQLLQGLRPGTTYSFQVVSDGSDDSGYQSVTSAVAQFTTLPPYIRVPDVPVISEVTSSNAVVTLNLQNDLHQLAHHYITYNWSSPISSDTNQFSVDSASDATQAILNFTNLLPGVTYNYSVVSVLDGHDTNQIVYTFMTNGLFTAASLISISNISYNNLTTNSVDITWDVQNNTGYQAGHFVTITGSDSPASQMVFTDAGPGMTNVILSVSGLVSGEAHSFTLTSFLFDPDSYGMQLMPGYSDVATNVLTVPVLQPHIRIINPPTASDVTNNSVTISWDYQSDDATNPVWNVVTYSWDGPDGRWFGQTNIVSNAGSSHASVTISGLLPGTQFAYSVSSAINNSANPIDSAAASGGEGSMFSTPASLVIDVPVSVSTNQDNSIAWINWHVSPAIPWRHSHVVWNADNSLVTNAVEDASGNVTAAVNLTVGQRFPIWVESTGDGKDAIDDNSSNFYWIEGAPLVVLSGLTIQPTASTDATVSWAVNSHGYSLASNVVSYWTANNTANTVLAEIDSSTGRAVANLTGLVAGVDYNVVALSDTGLDPTTHAGPSAVISSGFTSPLPLQTGDASWLPGSQMGGYYVYSLTASGGLGSDVWSVIDGSLPSGMTLDSNGNLSGTPTASGNFNFNVRVTDSSGATADKVLSMSVEPAIRITSKATVTPQSADSVRISWSVENRTALPAVHSVSYSWTGPDGSGSDIALADVDPGSGVVSVVIANLLPMANYSFQIQSFISDAPGYSAIGMDSQHYVFRAPGAIRITNLGVVDVTSTTAEVDWTVANDTAKPATHVVFYWEDGQANPGTWIPGYWHAGYQDPSIEHPAHYGWVWQDGHDVWEEISPAFWALEQVEDRGYELQILVSEGYYDDDGIWVPPVYQYVWVPDPVYDWVLEPAVYGWVWEWAPDYYWVLIAAYTEPGQQHLPYWVKGRWEGGSGTILTGSIADSDPVNGVVQVTLQNLLPGHTYGFLVKSILTEDMTDPPDLGEDTPDISATAPYNGQSIQFTTVNQDESLVALRNLEVDLVDATEAIVSWTVDSHGVNLTANVVNYWTNGGSVITVPAYFDPITDRAWAVLTNLFLGATYSFSVSSDTGLDPITHSSPSVTVNTNGLVTPSFIWIANPHHENLQTNTVDIVWDVENSSDYTATHMAMLSGPGIPDSPIVLSGIGPSGTNVVLSVSNLVAGGIYDYTAISFVNDPAGDGEQFNPGYYATTNGTFTMHGSPLVQISNLHYENLTAKSADIVWNFTATNDYPATHMLYHSTGDSPTAANGPYLPFDLPDNGQVRITVWDFQPCSTNLVAVQSTQESSFLYDPALTTAASSITVVTPPAIVMTNAPVRSTISGSNGNYSATLSWGYQNNTDNPVTHVVDYAWFTPDASGLGEAIVTSAPGGSSASVTIGNLQPQATYVFSINSGFADGDTIAAFAANSMGVFTTEDVAPSAGISIFNVAVNPSLIGDTSAVITWNVAYTGSNAFTPHNHFVVLSSNAPPSQLNQSVIAIGFEDPDNASNVTTVLTGLAAGQTNFFFVQSVVNPFPGHYATDLNGGAFYSFTNTASGAVDTNVFSGITISQSPSTAFVTNTSALISWQVFSSDDNPTNHTHFLVLSENATPAATNAVVTLGTEDANGIVFAHVTGLWPGRTYYYYVQSFTDSGLASADTDDNSGQFYSFTTDSTPVADSISIFGNNGIGGVGGFGSSGSGGTGGWTNNGGFDLSGMDSSGIRTGLAVGGNGKPLPIADANNKTAQVTCWFWLGLGPTRNVRAGQLYRARLCCRGPRADGSSEPQQYELTATAQIPVPVTNCTFTLIPGEFYDFSVEWDQATEQPNNVGKGSTDTSISWTVSDLSSPYVTFVNANGSGQWGDLLWSSKDREEKIWKQPVWNGYANPQTSWRMAIPKADLGAKLISGGQPVPFCGQGLELPETKEETEGTFVPFHYDHRAYQGFDTNAYPTLLPVVMHAIKPAIGGYYKLDWNTTYTRVWADTNRSLALSRDKYYNAQTNNTVYVEGTTPGVSELHLNWHGEGNNVANDLDRVKVTVFKWEGPLNVPNSSTHLYQVTGVPASGEWLSAENGKLIRTNGNQNTLVKCEWNRNSDRGFVGNLIYKAKYSYSWKFGVNVIGVKVENPDAALGGGSIEPFFNTSPGIKAEPNDVTQQPNPQCLSVPLESYANPSVFWGAKITLNGPNGGKGVDHIRVGFMQTVMAIKERAYYVTNGLTRTLWVGLEGKGPYIDYQDLSPHHPFYVSSSKSIFWEPNPQACSTNISASDRVREIVPFWFDRGANSSGANDTVLSRTTVALDFETYVVATTKDTDGWGCTNYTTRAQLSWTFNASGATTNIGGNVVWRADPVASSGALRGTNAWREPDVSEPPNTGNTSANTVWNSTEGAWKPLPKP